MKRNRLEREIESIENCMYHNWIGNIITGKFLCTLLTSCDCNKAKNVKCKGACQFYKKIYDYSKIILPRWEGY